MKFGKTKRCKCLYVGDEHCSFKPKPAATFTELGLSFAARMTDQQNQINGNLDTSSKECVRVNRRRMEGKVDFGYGMGIRLGPKPPQWLLTGQTTSSVIRAYAQVIGIETTSEFLVDVDFDALPDHMYGLYIATNCCGTKGANDGEGGCRTCTAIKGCCGTKTCADQSDDGAHCQCHCDVRDGCEEKPSICNCTHDELRCVWSDPVPFVGGCFDDTPRATRLNDDIRALVVKQVTNAKNGCCFEGWSTIDFVPQDLEDPTEQGQFVGMLKWDCSSTLKKLKQNVFKTNPLNISKKARRALNISQEKLNFKGYANSTVFNRVQMCVVYRREEDENPLLVRLNLYVPGTSGAPFRYTCGYDACSAMSSGSLTSRIFANDGY